MAENLFDAFYQRIISSTGIHSQTELASFLGVHRSAVTQAKHKGVVPATWVLKLSRLFDLDPHWLKEGVSQKEGLSPSREFQNIPKVKARLNAGGGSFEVSKEVQGYYSFRRSWLQRKGTPAQMVLMDILGDSMEPVLQEGDTVLIDQAQTEILAGSIYAVGIEDTVMVKRVEKHPYKLVLISANTHYSPIYLQGEEIDTVHMIGRVIWMCRELH